MSGISLWKIKRELKRLVRTGPNLAIEMVRKLYFRRYYDLITSRKIRRSFGAVPLGKEVAVYLIFPSSGVLESHIYMLRELGRAGISPVVVSNLTLSAVDRDRLSQLAARIIERPNVGYDFGGYRDGILEIAEFLGSFERLWLLNDSVWLVPQTESWFDQARALNRDFVAATSSFSIIRSSGFRTKQVEPDGYRSIAWEYAPQNPNFHYASYALTIGRTILSDPKFLAFWEKLEIRDDKRRTVRNGEIGLTQWILKHGYTHAATQEIMDLDQELANLGSRDLNLAARELVLLDDQQMVPIKERVLSTDQDSAEGRAERIGLILTAVARRGTVYALSLYILRHHGFSFLKKSPIWLSPEGSGAMLEYVSSLESRDGTHIARETRMLFDQRSANRK